MINEFLNYYQILANKMKQILGRIFLKLLGIKNNINFILCFK